MAFIEAMRKMASVCIGFFSSRSAMPTAFRWITFPWRAIMVTPPGIFPWLKLTDTPVRIHRIKLDLHQAFDWEDNRREALVEWLDQWRDGPEVKYSTGHRCDYYLECRGDQAAEEVKTRLREFGLAFESWGPQPEAMSVN